MSLPRLSVPYALLLYVGLLFGLRTFGVSGGSIDDAEQLLYSQSWAWAYSAHNPPGPTWITCALQALTGPRLLAVTLPKFLWLFVCAIALWQCALRLLSSRTLAVHATLWLAGIYYVIWECVLNYSHSVQVLAVSMLCVWQVLRMRRARTCVDYLLLGVLLALGMVSKFNFAVLVLAMGLASLAVPAYRAALLDARLGLTVLVAAGLVAPVLHAQWGLLAAQAAATTAKFALAPAWSLPVALKGAGTAVVALLSWLSPLLVFVLVAAPHVFKAVPAGKPVLTPDGGDAREDERWLRMLGLALLLAVMALVVGSRAAEARTHYYQVAVPLVLWLALRADLQRVDRRRWQAVSALCALLAVVAPALLALEISGAVKVTGKSRLAVPYAGLADALRASGFRQGMVVSQDWPHALSGNLRPYLDGSSFFSLAHPDYLPPLPAGDAQCLVVWQTGEAPAAVKTAPQAVQPLLARETTGLRYGQLVLRTRGPAGVKVGIGWALWPALAPCTTLVEAVRQQ